MPVFSYQCPKCGPVKRLLRPEEALGPVACRGCGAELVRDSGSNVSSQAIEVLDNGAQARPVERLSEAERIFKERSTKRPDRGKLGKLL